MQPKSINISIMRDKDTELLEEAYGKILEAFYKPDIEQALRNARKYIESGNGVPENLISIIKQDPLAYQAYRKMQGVVGEELETSINPSGGVKRDIVGDLNSYFDKYKIKDRPDGELQTYYKLIDLAGVLANNRQPFPFDRRELAGLTKAYNLADNVLNAYKKRSDDSEYGYDGQDN